MDSGMGEKLEKRGGSGTVELEILIIDTTEGEETGYAGHGRCCE